MFSPELVYACDIETLNDQERGFNGLDAPNSEITEIVVATDESLHGGGEVFYGSEAKILAEFGRFMHQLPPGLVSTWNGAFFDLPFIAKREEILGLYVTGMHLIAQPALKPKYEAMPWAATEENPGGGWTAVWHIGPQHFHSHLDVSQAYRRWADENDVKWGLKPVCIAQGIPMFEIPDGYANLDDYRQRLHERPQAEREAYVYSDGGGTRELALRMLGLDYTPYR